MSATSIPLGLEASKEKSAVWRRRVVAVILLLAIGGYFWVDSRYPSLLKKYHAGSHVKVSGAITFDTLYQVDRSMPLTERVWRTSVNWVNANRIGMTFAFFFGPAMLTFLGTLPRRRSKSKQLNALLGTLAGMPLGVCANCVAPIGRGMYAAGMSTEAVLAAMFSSPALNVVVLAMTFVLFPMALVLLKLTTVLLLIFVFGPYLAGRDVRDTGSVGEAACVMEINGAETWSQSLMETLKSYARSFWLVFRVGFPLMLLAAVLGALVIEVVPAQAIYAPASWMGILLIALVGAFLPVPMGFDVVMAYIAMTHGVPLPYVAVILCTLGIYSVYSAAVVGKTISWKVATASYAAVVILGMAAGIVTRLFL